MLLLGFFLGLSVCVGTLLALRLWSRYRPFSPVVTAFGARSTVHDIERRTIHAMLAAELAATRAARDAGTIDGSKFDEP
jgi:hypothetical protein